MVKKNLKPQIQLKDVWEKFRTTDELMVTVTSHWSTSLCAQTEQVAVKSQTGAPSCAQPVSEAQRLGEEKSRLRQKNLSSSVQRAAQSGDGELCGLIAASI